jgi:hypothetical protein
MNTKYKNNVFSTLFNDPDRLRDLYCALTGADIPPDVPVIVNTLQNVLFLGQVNDISFLVGSVLVVLIEHQSTINPKATQGRPPSVCCCTSRKYTKRS